MRFEELLHWNDGQFLQPHHFQYFQREFMEHLGTSHSFPRAYPWGFVDFEIDEEALSSARVIVKRFSAVLPDGTPLSMPGNCLLPELDLTETLKQNPNEIMVSVALPQWSEFEANLLAEGPAREKRLFVPQKKRLRDENSGENEITIITRRMNAHLVTNLNDNKNMRLLPALRLTVLSHDKTRTALTVSENYFPPFMILGPASPLYAILRGLLVDIRRCRDKAQEILASGNFKSDDLSGYTAYTVLRLKTLNVYGSRLSALLAANTPPFDFYLELISLLSELMSYDPLNSIREIQPYNHENSAPQFLGIIKDIRSFILQEGSVDYIRLDFTLADGQYLHTPIKPEDAYRAGDAYLAVKTSGDRAAVVKSIEEGDTFKLTNPASRRLRIRGLRLTEIPYPPRFLPVLNKTVWFKLDLEESARVWREIIEERGIAVDYVEGIFPELELSLFLTVGNT